MKACREKDIWIAVRESRVQLAVIGETAYSRNFQRKWWKHSEPVLTLRLHHVFFFERCDEEINYLWLLHVFEVSMFCVKHIYLF